MQTENVQSLIGRVAAVAADCADWRLLKAGVEDLRRLKSWVEGREVAFAQQIAKVSSFPALGLGMALAANWPRSLGTSSRSPLLSDAAVTGVTVGVITVQAKRTPWRSSSS